MRQIEMHPFFCRNLVCVINIIIFAVNLMAIKLTMIKLIEYGFL